MLAAYLRERAAAALGDAGVRDRPTQPLTALGLDSLAAVELKGGVEAALGLPLPLADLLQGIGVAELAAILLAGLDGERRPAGHRRGAAARALARGSGRLSRSRRGSAGSGSSTGWLPRGAPTTSPWRRATRGLDAAALRARPRRPGRPPRGAAHGLSHGRATSRCSGCCRTSLRTSRSRRWRRGSSPRAWPRRPGGRSIWRAGRCCGRGSSRRRTGRRSCSPSTTSWPTSPRWR